MAQDDPALDLDLIIETIGEFDGTWDLKILNSLSDRWVRSSQLRRRVSRKLDYRVFADTMTRLAGHGLVERRQRSRLHVEYRLSERGRAVPGLLSHIQDWGREHPQPQDQADHDHEADQAEPTPPAPRGQVHSAPPTNETAPGQTAPG